MGCLILIRQILKAWQFITYMFFHGATAYPFNMFALFSFHSILEYSIGPKNFFKPLFYMWYWRRHITGGSRHQRMQ